MLANEEKTAQQNSRQGGNSTSTLNLSDASVTLPQDGVSWSVAFCPPPLGKGWAVARVRSGERLTLRFGAGLFGGNT